MGRWVCPQCEREFDRTRQGHVCLPGNTVAETFAGARAWQRPICDAVIAHVESLGPVHVDAVGVGVFLKHQSKFAELRPMARALSLALVGGAFGVLVGISLIMEGVSAWMFASHLP